MSHIYFWYPHFVIRDASSFEMRDAVWTSILILLPLLVILLLAEIFRRISRCHFRSKQQSVHCRRYPSSLPTFRVQDHPELDCEQHQSFYIRRSSKSVSLEDDRSIINSASVESSDISSLFSMGGCGILLICDDIIDQDNQTDKS